MRQTGQQGSLWVALMEPSDVEKFWPDFAKVLGERPELWQPVTTLEAIRREVDDETMQMWGVGDGLDMHLTLITTIVDLKNKTREFQIHVCLGQQLPKYWRLIVETFEDAAMRLGCRTLMVETRRDGFMKLLVDEGYERRVCQMVRVLGKPVHATAN